MPLTADQSAAASFLLESEFAWKPRNEWADNAAKEISTQGITEHRKGQLDRFPEQAKILRQSGYHDQAKVLEDHHASETERLAKEKAAAPPPPAPTPWVSQVTNTTPVPGYVGPLLKSERRKAVLAFIRHPNAKSLVDAHGVNSPGLDAKEALTRAEAAFEAYHAAQPQKPITAQPQAQSAVPEQPKVRTKGGVPKFSEPERVKAGLNSTEAIARKMGLLVGDSKSVERAKQAAAHSAAIRGGRTIPADLVDKVAANLEAHGYNQAAAAARGQAVAVQAQPQAPVATASAPKPIGPYVPKPGKGEPYIPFRDAMDRFWRHPDAKPLLHAMGANDDSLPRDERMRRGEAAYEKFHGIKSGRSQQTQQSGQADPPPLKISNDDLANAKTRKPPAYEIQDKDIVHPPSRFSALVDAAKNGRLKDHLENGLGNFFDKFERVGNKALRKIGIPAGDEEQEPATAQQAAPRVQSGQRKYRYSAMDDNGLEFNHEVNAASRDEALRKAKALGHFVTKGHNFSRDALADEHEFAIPLPPIPSIKRAILPTVKRGPTLPPVPSINRTTRDLPPPPEIKRTSMPPVNGGINLPPLSPHELAKWNKESADQWDYKSMWDDKEPPQPASALPAKAQRQKAATPKPISPSGSNSSSMRLHYGNIANQIRGGVTDSGKLNLDRERIAEDAQGLRDHGHHDAAEMYLNNNKLNRVRNYIGLFSRPQAEALNWLLSTEFARTVARGQKSFDFDADMKPSIPDEEPENGSTKQPRLFGDIPKKHRHEARTLSRLHGGREVRRTSSGGWQVRAPKGGKKSEVNGVFYPGGQFMPIHGLKGDNPKSDTKEMQLPFDAPKEQSPKQATEDAANPQYAAKGNEVFDANGVRHGAFRNEEKARAAADEWNLNGKPGAKPKPVAPPADPVDMFPSLADDAPEAETAPGPESKPVEAEQESTEAPAETKAESKTSDGVIPGMEPEQADETPDEAAERQARAMDPDYEFARQSAVPNAGKDLKGSARHKRNAWKGLDEAEADGTAAELVTRDNLMKAEPHNLMVLAEENPMTALVGFFALRSLPAKPGSTSKRARKPDEETAKKDRRQYVEVYRELKDQAESLAKSEPDHEKAMKHLSTWVRGKINELRGIEKGRNDYMAQAGVIGTDRYNNTANSMVDVLNSLSAGRKTGVSGRTAEFKAYAKKMYGNDPTNENLSGHAQDVIEGRSMPASFDAKGTARKFFSPAEMYVKQPTKRTGGRDVSHLTKNPKLAAAKIKDMFGASGIQWGQSTTDDEREHHAPRIAAALVDLADITGLHPKDIGLGGNLGFAIGARGHGDAAAHYEPHKLATSDDEPGPTINLTRKSGVGALAHEWGHALDHSLGGFKQTFDGEKLSGDYYSEHVSPQRFVKDETSGSYGRPVDHSKEPMWQAMDGVRKAWANSGFSKRLSKVISGMNKDGLLSPKKAEYYRSIREQFARTFERHVQHALKTQGRENTYLSGLTTENLDDSLWPTDAETAAMAPAFENLLSEYRKHKYGDSKPQQFSRDEAMSYFLQQTGEQTGFNTALAFLVENDFARPQDDGGVATMEPPVAQVKPVRAPRAKLKAPVVPTVENPNFKSWHHGSKVVNEDGGPKVVYHGARRPDRIAEAGQFDPKRASSGPMSFFTDDPEIANGYATGKQDTSLEQPSDYAEHFRVPIPGLRKPIPVDRAWHFLPHEQRQRIAAMAPRIKSDDEGQGQIEIGDEDHNSGLGGYDQHIKEARGNHLSALVNEWLNSGNLYGSEHEFLDVLKHAGLPNAQHHDPYQENPGIFPVHLAIRNPLQTHAIPDDVRSSLQQAGKRMRGKQGSGVDQWDKRYMSGKDWLSRLDDDHKNGTTHAWTSIPDWVTETLKQHGYDGIQDRGGKNSPEGYGHNVWIPFHPHQVKSAVGNKGTFDPGNKKFLFSRAEQEAFDLLLASV